MRRHLGRCVLFGLVIIVAAVLVWPFLPRRLDIRSQTFRAGTQVRIDALSRALEEYGGQYRAFPPDSGVGLHPELDQPAECLVYYLSGPAIYYDLVTHDYPWSHDVYTDVPGALGEGRGKLTVHYKFKAEHLGDAAPLGDRDGDRIPEAVDSWGNPLLYNAGAKQNGPFNQNGAPKHNKSTFDLSSAGPDGKFGTKDDITNWGN